MKADINIPGDMAAGIRPTSWELDMGDYSFTDTDEREGARRILAEACNQLADTGVRVIFDDEYPQLPEE